MILNKALYFVALSGQQAYVQKDPYKTLLKAWHDSCSSTRIWAGGVNPPLQQHQVLARAGSPPPLQKVDFEPTLSQLWVVFRPTLGGLWADFGPTLDQLWADFRPTLD